MIILLLQFSRVEAFAWWRVVITVEIPGVSRSVELRLDGRVELAVVKLLPVNVFKPWMCLDIPGASRQITEPVRRVDSAELSDDVFCFWRHSAWILNLAGAYSFVSSATINTKSELWCY